ncbi:MAG: hypothetical protein AAF915_01915 [Cyanobacteria bacterium P01_D01_bin.50]
MTLPTNFSEWEHLQNIIRLDHNKAIYQYFNKTPNNDLSTTKSKLKHACLIKDNDTATMVLMRMWLFEITVGRAQAIQTPVYGIPVQELQREIKFKPQIRLYFREPYDKDVHGDGTSRVNGEITFRLVDESSETISRAKAEKLARDIKNEFAQPIFTWEKGWFKSTYLDIEKGYDLRLLVKSKTEGERIVKQVLKILNHTFNKDNFQFIEHDRTYPVNPGTHRVYGSTVKKWRKRPRANLKFNYAQLLIHGRIKPVNLVSVGGRLQSVIEKV